MVGARDERGVPGGRGVVSALIRVYVFYHRDTEEHGGPRRTATSWGNNSVARGLSRWVRSSSTYCRCCPLCLCDEKEPIPVSRLLGFFVTEHTEEHHGPRTDVRKETVTRGNAEGVIFQYGRERGAAHTRAMAGPGLPTRGGAGRHGLPAVFAVRAHCHAWSALVERLRPRREDCGCS